MTAYVQSMWDLRHFWLSLVRHDLLTRYRRSMLGIGWSLVHPIAMTIILCTVFHKLFNVKIEDFGPHVMAGLCFWAFVTTSVNLGCQTFFSAESYIRQYPAPLAIYPLRAVLGAGFHFVLALAVVVLLVRVLRGPGTPLPLITVLPSLMLLLVFGWALATLAAFANVHFPDTQHLSDVLLQVLFYMTPIIYPSDMVRERGMGWLLDYNPMATMLELIRGPILAREFPSLHTVGVAILTTSVVTALAVVVLVRGQKQLVCHL